VRIAVLHFHLRPGGVTRVIELAVEALQHAGAETLVLSGEPPPATCRLPPESVATVPELSYGVTASRQSLLLEGVESAIRRRWGRRADVIHIHNHSLGKNFALPGAVSCWAVRGQPLLLQVHDFAENGRPANYANLLAELGGPEGLQDTLYPHAPHVGYATLNSADRLRLASAGAASLCEILPNPASLPPSRRCVQASDLGAETLAVYPTRAIRRKNIGEALLWAAVAPQSEKTVFTAAPQTAQDLPAYDAWRSLAGAYGLPAIFDGQRLLGCETVDFLHSADHCLTTSIAEGFGMAFLEPWLAGRPLRGRDIPSVTRDFRAAGLKLGALYPAIPVPLAWMGRDRVEAVVETSVRQTCSAYRIPCEPDFARLAIGSVIQGSAADFGRLDETLQREIIIGLAEGRFSRSEIARPATEIDVAHNHALVREKFSLSAYGHRLAGVYARLAAAPIGAVEFLDSLSLLRQSLHLNDFFALRS